MTDEELSQQAQAGQESAVNQLLTKYKPLVNQIARSYFLTGGEMEDIVQEGMIGLFKAIMHYNGKSASFKTFASTCIKHQIQSAVRVASSEKNKILSSALPIIDLVNTEEEDDKSEIIFPSDLPSPDERLLEKERIIEIVENIRKTLSKLELEVLSLYLKGFSYNEISKQSGLSKKSVDNALTRIKNKLAFLKCC